MMIITLKCGHYLQRIQSQFGTTTAEKTNVLVVDSTASANKQSSCMPQAEKENEEYR